MEKILVNNDGMFSVYDTEKNSLVTNSPVWERMVRNIYCANTDGLIITENEVIDIKAGETVLTFSFWSDRERKSVSKAIVISDPTIAHDLDELEKLRQEHDKKLDTNESC